MTLSVVWAEGAPPAGGFVLTKWLRCGNLWVYVFQIAPCPSGSNKRVYLDHRGGGYAHELDLGELLGWAPIEKATEAMQELQQFWLDRVSSKEPG